MANVPLLTNSADLAASQTSGVAAQLMPTGVILPFAGNTAPSGWLACDGSAVSRTTYASLFTTIGTTYGTGDGSTTFNLPDFRGRFPRFNDAMFGGTAASRDTGRVHGSAQGQATAKNGLTASVSGSNSASSISATSSSSQTLLVQGPVSNPLGNSGSVVAYVTYGSFTPSISGTAAAQAWSGSVTVGAGDSETRPINLAVNAIIKI